MTNTSAARQDAVEKAVIEALKALNPHHPDTLPGLVEKYGTPGVSVAVFRDGRIDWAAGYGTIHSGQPSPIQTTTRFQAASISKPVTALAALRMVEAGLLDLDGDVNDQLQGWKIPACAGWTPRISLRMLLSHSAGLSQAGFHGYQPGAALPSLRDILEGAPNTNSDPIRPMDLPGLSFRYSGGGTTVVQWLMGERSEQPFETLMEAWVLAPLAMHDSHFHQPPPPHLTPPSAQGHYQNGQPLAEGWVVHPELAAAGLWTTPSDLARFALAIQAGLKGEHPLISAQVGRWMTTPQVTDEAGGIALGFFIGGADDQRFFEHTGGNIGFRCHLKAWVDGRGGFAVMTNSDSGMEMASIFEQAICSVYGWSQPELATPTPLNAALYAGRYTWANSTLVLQADADALTLLLPGQPPLTLTPIAADTFSTSGLQTRFIFERDPQGQVTRLIIHQADQVIHAARSGEHT